MNLKGKTVLFLGSSVTYGAASGGVAFPELMAEQCGLVSVKEAVSGTTLADMDETSYVSRLKNNVDPSLKVDLFICQLSTNDASAKRNIDLEKTKEAIRFILSYVKETFHCPMAFYTGTKFDNDKYKEMIDFLYSLQKEYEFSILDLWSDEEMLSVSPEDYQRFMHDPIHPNLVGYTEWWTPKFIEFCEKL